MKILLVSVNPAEISWATSSGLIDGVVTTPGLLSDEAGATDWRELLEKICRDTALPVYAAVGGVSGKEVHQHGRELMRISDRIVVYVPLIEDALEGIRRLSADGVRVGATFIFTTAQAILAAKVGACMVSVPVDQLAAVGQEPGELLREVRAVFDMHDVETDIVAMLPKAAAQFAECAVAGADTIAVSAGVLRSLLVHPLTDRGIDQFLSELSQRPRARTS